MLGWTRTPRSAAQAFLPKRYAELPEIGRLTGRGNTVSLENVVKLAPDLVLDVGDTTETYVSLADRVQAQTRIPDVLVAGRLAQTLAVYAEAALNEAQKQIATIPVAGRPSVYVARGPHGLESAVAGSIGSEVVDLIGARNVIGKEAGPRAIVDVSPEQILAWQPDVILTTDRRFHAAVHADPVWQQVKAVQAGHVHIVPDLPFSWLDEPPAPNRLIGLLWLGKLRYPASFPQDIRAEARRFYTLFYQQEPTSAQLDSLPASPQA
jgi:iron complex transport system substrate-binding protein